MEDTGKLRMIKCCENENHRNVIEEHSDVYGCDFSKVYTCQRCKIMICDACEYSMTDGICKSCEDELFYEKYGTYE